MIRFKSITELYLNLWIVVLILLFENSLNAQVNLNGNPFVKNYSPEVYNAHSQNWAITKDSRGIMYFANNFGLMQFNGSNWRLYVNDSSANMRSLAVDNNGFVYYGSSQDFGVMIPDSLGTLRPFSLYKVYNRKDPDFNVIWCINIIGNEIFFQANEKIFKLKLPFSLVDLEKTKNNFTVFTPENTFHWSFVVHNKFYVRENGKGLLVLDNNKLVPVHGGEIFANERIYTMLPYSDEEILIGTREGGLYLLNPSKSVSSIQKFNCAANDQIIESQLYGGTSLPNRCFAFATLNNGVIIINDQGQIIEQLNVESGLPDQQVYTVYGDKQSGNLWFATDQSGIFNVNISSPFREWGKQQGLNGVVSDLIRYKGKIYVSTNRGVYVLDDVLPGISKFKPIEGISSETWDLLEFKELNNNESHLLVATINGVYEIKDNKASLIIKDVYVFQMLQSTSNPGILYLGYPDGFAAAEYNQNSKKWGAANRNMSVNNTIRSIYEKTDGQIYLGTEVSGYLKLKDLYDTKPLVIDTALGLQLKGSLFKVFNIEDEIVFATYNGLFKFDESINRVKPYVKFGEELSNKDFGVFNMLKLDNEYWLSIYSNNLNGWQGVVKFIRRDTIFEKHDAFSKILPEKVANAMFDDKNSVWIANDKGLYKFDKTKEKDYSKSFLTNILKVTTTDDSLLFDGKYYTMNEKELLNSGTQTDLFKPELKYKDNQITFSYAASFYEQEENTLYSYRLIGSNERWSKWSKETKFPFTNLSPGDYRFEIKAMNIYGTTSEVTSYEFTVLPPWYMTIFAYICFGLLAIVLVWLIVKLNIKRLQMEKERLEVIVEERTAEIRLKNVELEQQKEEIMAQRDEIEEQRDRVTLQKEQIEEQKKNITDSIHYASRIQEALLPPESYLKELIPDHFILFKPRDIVSGDFYWTSRKNNKSIIVAADCTGHGVPGAFMSMLGIAFLNEIINKFENLTASQILDELKANVKKALRQTGKDNEAKDGMDMALCIIDYENMILEYAGAYNSLIMIRNNEVIKYEADRMPIGIYHKEKLGFTNNVIEMKKGDNFYIHSDGYIDQFGGDLGGKLMSKRFKELLLLHHQKPVMEQKKALEEFLEHWLSFKNSIGETYKQLDDILIIGIKV